MLFISVFRIMSIEDPFRSPELASLCFRLLSRAQVMGFLPEDADGQTRLDRRLLEGVGERLARAGVAQEAALLLADAAGNEERTADALRRTIDAVDASPHPEGEWAPARELLGDELLARLVRVSPSSLRRYATGMRPTPDGVAWRLHAVARILAALVGSYNAYGVRRWFERPRTALQGRAPAELVAEAGSEEDAGLARVLALAESLTGAGAAT